MNEQNPINWTTPVKVLAYTGIALVSMGASAPIFIALLIFTGKNHSGIVGNRLRNLQKKWKISDEHFNMRH